MPWLFLSAASTTLPHALHLPLWLSGFAALLLLWGGWLNWRQQALPNRWLLSLAVIAASAGILWQYHTLFGRDAGVAMLVLFMAMKLLEVKSRRDGLVVIVLGYFLLLTHYFYSQSIATGLWLLATVGLLTASLIRLHAGLMPVKETLRYAGLLSAQSIPFMLVLFLLFPRISGPLWGLPQDAQAGHSGLSEQMSPGSMAQLVLSSEIAFRVQFAGAIPPKEKLYWRGPVMEVFDGLTWSAHQAQYPSEYAAEIIETLSPPLTYETTLEAHQQRWLLALDAPLASTEFALNGTLTATNPLPITQRQRFRLAASLDYRFNVDEAAKVLQRNLQLPPGHNPQTLALAESWRATSQNQQEIIQQALQLFASKQFFYTLQPPLLGEHRIDDFLFQSQRGFCEHYAAAFVVLMRAAGIPARVVTGYQGGERNPVDGYLVIRQSDAHAWTEVWLPHEGWRRIDPTAMVAPSRVESGIAAALPNGEPLPTFIQLNSPWLLALRDRWEAANNAWNQHILGYNPQRQRELLARLGLPNSDWQSLAGSLSIACLLVLAAITFWTLYTRRPQDPTTQLWQKALRWLARRQVNCAPWETPLALVKRLETEHPELAPPLARVAAAYLLARYGRPADDLSELRRAIARLP
jgi:transglutaminase-like putative cysteine protease